MGNTTGRNPDGTKASLEQKPLPASVDDIFTHAARHQSSTPFSLYPTFSPASTDKTSSSSRNSVRYSSSRRTLEEEKAKRHTSHSITAFLDPQHDHTTSFSSVSPSSPSSSSSASSSSSFLSRSSKKNFAKTRTKGVQLDGTSSEEEEDDDEGSHGDGSGGRSSRRASMMTAQGESAAVSGRS